jgi:hypothetical protein
MSVAQTRAARRKFRLYYRNDTPIGTPHYKRRSVERQQRREAAYRERQKKFTANKAKSKK